MSRRIRIENVPEELHRRLVNRAAAAGQSLSAFVLSQLERSLERPTRAELLARIRRLPVKSLDPSPAALIRQQRGL